MNIAVVYYCGGKRHGLSSIFEKKDLRQKKGGGGLGVRLIYIMCASIMAKVMEQFAVLKCGIKKKNTNADSTTVAR